MGRGWDVLRQMRFLFHPVLSGERDWIDNIIVFFGTGTKNDPDLLNLPVKYNYHSIKRICRQRLLIATSNDTHRRRQECKEFRWAASSQWRKDDSSEHIPLLYLRSRKSPKKVTPVVDRCQSEAQSTHYYCHRPEGRVRYSSVLSRATTSWPVFSPMTYALRFSLATENEASQARYTQRTDQHHRSARIYTARAVRILHCVDLSTSILTRPHITHTHHERH